MAILNNVEVFFVRCDPAHPNAQFNKKNPRWEVQLITSDPAQKEEWAGHGLRPKLMVGKEGAPNEGEPILNAKGQKQWKLTLTKNSLKEEDGVMVKAKPVEVVDGNCDEVDPNTIGNGSVCNVRVYLYQYDSTKRPGTKDTGHILMGIQVLKHIVYTPKPREGFGKAETTRIVPQSEEMQDDKPRTPPTPKIGGAGVDNLPEDKF